MRRYVLIAAIVAAVAAAAPRLAATVLVPADIGELTRDALAVARGRVVAVQGQWGEGRRTIETIVTLDAESYLKGAFGQTLQFRVPGGVLGRYRQIVLGAPRFEVGDRVIVFLGSRGPSVPYLLGLGQGVYRVIAAGDGTPIVTPPAILSAPPGPVQRGALNRRPAPLAEFEREIRALAAGAR